MVEHIKLKNYKGIKEVQLNGLKHINVICGRNSSGKSSVLEAMITADKHAVGRNPDYASLINNVESQSRHYDYTYQAHINDWIRSTIERYNKPYVFSDEMEDFNNFAKSVFGEKGLYNIGLSHDAFPQHYENTFKSLNSGYNPILIPPKRNLATCVKLTPDEGFESNGRGCLNRLFYLKNQDAKSKSYNTFQRIHHTFYEITNQNFNIVLSSDLNLQLQFEDKSGWRNADDCGLGLRDVLSITTFVLASDYDVYLIEEPESHLHADFQKKIVTKLLKKLKDKQFILSTHAPIFLEPTATDKIYFCQFSNGEVKVTDEASLSKITNMLGHPVTEVLTSDALIFVEGPTDVPVYQTMLNWWGAMDKYNIRMWPLGGDIMGSLDMDTFGGRNNVFAIIDSDPGSKGVRDKFKKACENAKIPVFQLERYAIENYFTLPALKAVFGDSIPEAVKDITPEAAVDKQLGFSKERTLKTKNTDVIAQMTLPDITGTDLEKGLKTIIEQIEAVHAIKEQQDEVS